MGILGSSYSSSTEGQTLQNSNLVTGVPLPTPPGFSEDWKLADYKNEIERYIKQLHDYLRRLAQSVGQTIVQGGGEGGGGGGGPVGAITDWRLDSTTKKFQYFKNSEWHDATGVQPTELSQIQTDTTYSTTTHVLAKNTFSNVLILTVDGSATSDANVDTAVECTPTET